MGGDEREEESVKEDGVKGEVWRGGANGGEDGVHGRGVTGDPGECGECVPRRHGDFMDYIGALQTLSSAAGLSPIPSHSPCMAIAYTLQVGDSSPTISYSNLSSWVPCFSGSGCDPAPGQRGLGSSSHNTSHDGATLSIHWVGTGIDMYGLALHASYDAWLDGTTPVKPAALDSGLLVTLSGLPVNNHSLTLTARPSTQSSFVSFYGAVVTASVSTIVSSTTVPDSAISYRGEWSYQCGLLPNLCFHESQHAGDNAQFDFTGTSVSISGLRNFTSGHYNVSLDGVISDFDSQSSWMESAVMFFQTGLDPVASHRLIITNTEDKLLAIGAISVNSLSHGTTSGSSGGLSKGAIAGLVVGLVLGLVLVAFLSILLWRRLRWRQPLKFVEPSIHTDHSRPEVIDIRHIENYADIENKPSDLLSLDHPLAFAPNQILEPLRGRKHPPPNLPRSPTGSSPSSGNQHFAGDANLGSLLQHTEPADPKSYLSVNIKSPFHVDFESVPSSIRRNNAKPAGPRQPRHEPKEPLSPLPRLPKVFVTPDETSNNTNSFLDLDSSSSLRSSGFQSSPHAQQSPTRARTSAASSNPSRNVNRDSEPSRCSSRPLSFAIVMEQPNMGMVQTSTHPYSSPQIDTFQAVSPTESLPVTISELRFRDMNDESRRASGLSESVENSRISHSAPPASQTFSSAAIVRKLFGDRQIHTADGERRRSRHRRSHTTPAAILPKLVPNR